MGRIDMNPGFDPGSSSRRDPNSISMHPRKHRKQVIESDPEDDLLEQATRPKYSRGPEMSTPTYSMDTDISTLEAPTFSTLNKGPSQTMMSLRWDHQVNEMGRRVVNPILHVCDKCKRPILQYGRLTCKHVLCLNCATIQKQSGGACGRCNAKVLAVEQAGLGCIYMCSYGGSRYGPDGCRRTYLSERDLEAHKKLDIRIKCLPAPRACPRPRPSRPLRLPSFRLRTIVAKCGFHPPGRVGGCPISPSLHPR